MPVGMCRRRGLMPLKPMKLCWTSVAPEDGAPRVAGLQERGELGPEPALGRSRPGNSVTISWRPAAGALVGVERVGVRRCPLPIKTISGVDCRSASLRVRIVDVPDDLGRGPVEPDQVEQGAQVALGLGGLAAAERAARRHLGQLGRHLRVVGRERVEEEQGASALLDVVGQVVDLFLASATTAGPPGARSGRTRSAHRARPS